MEILEDELDNLFAGHAGEINTEKPAKIIKVHSQYLVDVEYYENGNKDIIFNVPVKHLQTSSAFVFLKLKEGDKGTLRFFDTDIDVYKSGSNEISTEVRKHDINDNYYDFGFYPDAEQYPMPDCEICIGLKDQKALIQIMENGNISIIGQSFSITANSVTVNAPNISLGSNTTIDGKSFLSHTHFKGQDGQPTGEVI